MLTIGFRAGPSKVTFAIYSVDDDSIVNTETLLVPEALSTPERLKYVRNSVLDILLEYGISNAVVRLAEYVPHRAPDPRRLQLEAVIQEAFASSGLMKYAVVQISTLAPLLNEKRENIKKYVNDELTYDSIPAWGEMSPECREAILCAKGARNV